MKNEALISVIVPVYNVEQYLCKCVDSVLVQTYKNLEIILVDDGSLDSSGKICDDYAQKDPRVKVIHQQNAGLSAARNSAIKIAHGEYFSFIDSDDWVEPAFIEQLYKLAVKYNAPISVVGRYTVFPHFTEHRRMQLKPNEEKLFSTLQPHFDAQQTLELFLISFDRTVTSKLFHASLFKQVLFPAGLTFEDSWTLYRVFQYINKVAVINIPLYYHNRTNENSLSRGKFRLSMLDYFKVTDDFIAAAKTFKTPRMLREIQRDRLAHICGFLKRIMISNFNDWSVIGPLQQELRHNLWLLLLHPRSLKVTAFGICSAIHFNLTKKVLEKMNRSTN